METQEYFALPVAVAAVLVLFLAYRDAGTRSSLRVIYRTGRTERSIVFDKPTEKLYDTLLAAIQAEANRIEAEQPCPTEPSSVIVAQQDTQTASPPSPDSASSGQGVEEVADDPWFDPDSPFDFSDEPGLPKEDDESEQRRE